MSQTSSNEDCIHILDGKICQKVKVINPAMNLILSCVEYELTVVVARVTVDNWDLSPHSARKVRIKALMKTALIKIVLMTFSYT